ncbi:MAG: SWIM zinc finger family protein [Actinomycetota bacterium]
MSIVVVPGQFRGVPHPAGKLASTLLSVTVAGMADPARFRRGKFYVAEGAVLRLEVSPGTLTATVAGSRSKPYQVLATVPLVPRVDHEALEALRTQLTRLTPEPHELLVSCTCPDLDDPCKHAVASVLAFANELVARPELLVQWRCEPDDSPTERPRVGARAKPGERHLRLAGTPAQQSPRATPPWESDEWVAFLGSSPAEPPDVPREPAALGRAVLGTIDLAAVVRSAIDALTFDS